MLCERFAYNFIHEAVKCTKVIAMVVTVEKLLCMYFICSWFSVILTLSNHQSG